LRSMARLHLQWWDVLVCTAMTSALAEPTAPTCAAGQKCSSGGVDEFGYYWPRARGHVGAYSLTNHTAPKDLSRHVAWKWNHRDGRYGTVITGGPLIDHKKNLYISTETGVYKFSPDGHELWFYRPVTSSIHTAPSIMDGTFFGNVGNGYMFALDMETGKEKWLRRFADNSGDDTAYVESYRGVVINALQAAGGGAGNVKIVAVNATNGRRLWDYSEARTLWNFMAMFVGDDTFIYQDISGGVYRRNLFNGTRLWYTEPPFFDQGSFTDGFVQLGPGGPDGIAYTCSDHGMGQAGQTGVLRAYRVQDGRFLWGQELLQPCTTWAVSDGQTVAVGSAPLPGFVGASELPSWAGPRAQWLLHKLSMWLGPKQRYLWGNPPLYSEMHAFDAKTGAVKWRFADIPPWEYKACRGDEEGLLDRLQKGIRPGCATAGWGSSTMSGDGTIYTPHMDGHLYAIGDANGDGTIDSNTEAVKFETGSASLHMGTAWAPGMMAQATCDTLWVFKF